MLVYLGNALWHLYRIWTHLKCAVITVYMPTLDSGYLTLTLLLTLNKSAFPGIFVLQILCFETQIAFRHKHSSHVLLFRAMEWAKNSVYADHPVFSTSKVQ